MLTADEESFVVDFLASYLATLQDFRTAAVTYLPSDLARTIGAGQTPDLCAREVVQACIRSGFTFRPIALVSLLAVHRGTNARIGALVARLEQLTKPSTDTHFSKVRVLASGLPFVNRTKLRTITAKFLDEAALRTVLVVSGLDRSGKSYTAPYLRHVGAAVQQVGICDLEYAPEQLASTKPMDVAKDIVAGVGRSTTRLLAPDTNETRWLQNLARDVVEEAVQTGQRWWFVLDGLYGKGLRNDTRDFVNAFADLASRGKAQRFFRVFLLGFERSALKLSIGSLETEELGPVDDSEVIDCVREALKRSKTAINDHQPFIDDVLAQLPAAPARLEEINRRLVRLIDSIDEENQHG